MAPAKVHDVYGGVRRSSGWSTGNPQAAADWQAFVLGELNQKQVLHIGNLRGHVAGEVVHLRPVFVQVVEFPFIFIRRPFLDAFG